MGVAQRFFLVPLIILSFINDVPEYISSKILVFYTDDTSLAVIMIIIEK